MAQMREGGGQNWQNQAVQAANKVETMVLYLGADSLLFFFPFYTPITPCMSGQELVSPVIIFGYNEPGQKSALVKSRQKRFNGAQVFMDWILWVVFFPPPNDRGWLENVDRTAFSCSRYKAGRTTHGWQNPHLPSHVCIQGPSHNMFFLSFIF